MIERVFLGWDEPFLRPAASWLLSLGPALADAWLLVPTSQAGRALAEEMTRQAKALLAPKITTPGAWMAALPSHTAPDWVEALAWAEVLSSQTDWEPLAAAFPTPCADDAAVEALARELTSLRRSLQDAGLMLRDAAAAMADTIDGERWAALTLLEEQVEQQLQAWNLVSRNRVLAGGLPLPTEVQRVVLVGITAMPPCVERSIAAWSGKTVSLIGAPESLADRFSAAGLPLPCWSHLPLPWPTSPEQGAVHLTADPSAQAAKAIDCIAFHATPADQVALGCADAATTTELTRQLGQAGWSAFSPGSPTPTSGLLRWLHVWLQWLETPSLPLLADLLALPETEALRVPDRAKLSRLLARYRENFVSRDIDDFLLHHRGCDEVNPTESISDSLTLRNGVEPLIRERSRWLVQDADLSLSEWLQPFAAAESEMASVAATLSAWWLNATAMRQHCRRPISFWLRLMLEQAPTPSPIPPPGRVIDVQGWLELFFEAGQHLVLCGLNEGNVPAPEQPNTWISELASARLGLRSRDERSARDAFLFHAMISARQRQGRVDLLCAKTAENSQPVLPSRLLLQCHRSELAQRVRHLFAEVAPSDAGVRPCWEWKWTPPTPQLPTTLSVTALRDYLTCPFRFYLTHLLRMRDKDPDRTEWSSAEFGTIAHSVLEAWGRDPIARDLDDASALSDWLTAKLATLCATQFANRPPLGIRLQIESLRLRLAAFATLQAKLRQEGWAVSEVETKVQLIIQNVELRATIDRIDRHPSGAIRVIDYKTGDVPAIEQAHRRTIKTNTKVAEHLDPASPVFLQRESSQLQWTNLQLPLYAVAIQQAFLAGNLPVPCYLTLGKDGSEALLQSWDDFSQEDADSAWNCADWIIGQIRAGVFHPPADKVSYDAFKVLTAGKTVTETFEAITQPATAPTMT